MHTRYSDWIKIGENMDNKGSKSDKPKLMVVKPENNLTAKQELGLFHTGSPSFPSGPRSPTGPPSPCQQNNLKKKSQMSAYLNSNLFSNALLTGVFIKSYPQRGT